MTLSIQFENGCVPAAAMRRPTRSAASARSRRVRMISSASSGIVSQIFVPTSTIDWCISRLMFSPNADALDASSSETCERSSQVFGSTIWNSSSTPTVKAWSMRLTLSYVDERSPKQRRRERTRLEQAFVKIHQRETGAALLFQIVANPPQLHEPHVAEVRGRRIGGFGDFHGGGCGG